MARYQFADLDKWVENVKKRKEAVVKQALNDMLNDIDIVPGITRGGGRQLGTIPRDIGALARSLQSTTSGSVLSALDGTGETSFTTVIASGSIGDTFSFTWGGAAAPYAVHVHYGARGIQGTFWRDIAVEKFQSYVDQATEEAIRRFG